MPQSSSPEIKALRAASVGFIMGVGFVLIHLAGWIHPISRTMPPYLYWNRHRLVDETILAEILYPLAGAVVGYLGYWSVWGFRQTGSNGFLLKPLRRCVDEVRRLSRANS